MPASTLDAPSATPRRRRWLAALLAVLAVAAFLRFDGLGEPSLWLDEILHLEKALDAADEPWHGWITGVSVDRENGSLYYAGQFLGLSLFDGEVAVRVVPAVLGVLTVALLFSVAWAASGSRRVALVAAALLAVSPLHVYYSREGRPYAAVMLLAMVLLLLALRERQTWARYAVYGACVATAYLGAVAAPVLISCGILATLEWLRNRRSSHWVLASGSALLLGLLLFPTVERFGGAVGAHNPTARWQVTEPLSGLALDRLLASLTVSGTDRGTTTGLSFLLLGLALWGAMAMARRHPRRAYWLIGLWILPIATWLAILVAMGHWYNVRYTSAGLPAFLALVAVGGVDLWQRLWRWAPQHWNAGRWNAGRGSIFADALLALGLLWVLTPLWHTARAEPWEKPDWRGVAGLLGELAQPGEPVITRGFWGATCIGHYVEQLEIPLEIYEVNYDPARARELTAQHPRAWVLSAGFREVPEFRAWTQGLDPVLRQPLGQIELFFSPGFEELLDDPRRVESLLAAARRLGEDPARQELGASELLLGSGWSYPEAAPDGRTFRWAQGETAQIALPWNHPQSPQPNPRQLRLRVLPFPSPDRPPQTLEIAVHGSTTERVALEPGWQEISLPLPASAEAPAGPLALVTFRFGWSQSPRDLDAASADPRSLAVAFDFAEVVAP